MFNGYRVVLWYFTVDVSMAKIRTRELLMILSPFGTSFCLMNDLSYSLQDVGYNGV